MKTEEKYKFSFHELSEKDYKSLKILSLIIAKHTVSRTEISKTTGINIVSISNYINGYIGSKLIIEKGFDVSTGGRKPELVELNKKENHVIGIEIGGSYARVILSDIGMDVLDKRSAKIEGGVEEAVSVASGLIEESLKKSGINSGSVRAVGLGAGEEDCVAIAKGISDKSGLRVFSGDIPCCAAFGERMAGGESASGDMLYIYSDRGYGVVIKEDGYMMSGENSKYLNPWSEWLGAVSLARSDVSRGVGTAIVGIAGGKMDSITEDTLIEAAKKKDEVAISIMRSVGVGLGLRIAYLVNIFGPKRIVIGGGIEKAGDMILDHIRKEVGKLSLKDKTGGLVIGPGVLGEDAVCVGAAFLASREIFLKA